MSDLHSYLEDNLRRHAAFLARRSAGDLMVYATRPLDIIRSEYCADQDVLAVPSPLSQEYLVAHAYDMGVQAVRDAWLVARHQHEKIGDDYCPSLICHWGAGYQAAMFSGTEVVFPAVGRSSSYTTRRVIETWDDVPTAFRLDNKWVDYVLEFWRGVESQDLTGLLVSPVYSRVPLDLANDMRGDQLFVDLYDAPDEVDVLLEHCTRNIIALDKVFRSEIRCLREGLGGALGTALAPRTMLFNGDPIDLISEQMGERFNRPWMEKITEYAGACLLHHHSIGAARALSVSRIKGLTVQEIQQDPNGPPLTEMFDESMIQASLHVPILLEWNLDDFRYLSPMPQLDALLEKARQGRFILHIASSDLSECRSFVESVRRVSNLG